MRKFPIALAAALLAVAQPTLAACGGEYCSGVRVTLVLTDGNGSNWISTSDNETALSCSPDSGTLLRIDQSSPHSDWLFSALLTAYLTNQTVTLRVNSSGQCVVSYMFMGTL